MSSPWSRRVVIGCLLVLVPLLLALFLEAYFARLWRYAETRLWTGRAEAHFTYPTDQAVNVDPFQPFAWEQVAGADGYFIYIGTAPGQKDVYGSNQLPAGVTSRTVWGLLPEKLYYARLWTVHKEDWSYSDVSFRTATAGSPLDRNKLHSTVERLTARVRESTEGTTNTPLPDTPLAAELAIWNKTSAWCVEYSFTLLELLAKQHISARRVTLTLVGNSFLSHTLTEYYDPYVNGWVVADPTFGLVYYDDSSQKGRSAAQLSDSVRREAWDEIPVKFVTPRGAQYANNYYLDPVTLFLHVLPEGTAYGGNLPISPLRFLIPVSDSHLGSHGVYVFEFPEGLSSAKISNLPGPHTSRTGDLAISTADQTSWSAAITLNDGWRVLAPASGLRAYRFRRVLF